MTVYRAQQPFTALHLAVVSVDDCEEAVTVIDPSAGSSGQQQSCRHAWVWNCLEKQRGYSKPAENIDEFKGRFSLGRKPTCDLVMKHRAISTVHATIDWHVTVRSVAKREKTAAAGTTVFGAGDLIELHASVTDTSTNGTYDGIEGIKKGEPYEIEPRLLTPEEIAGSIFLPQEDFPQSTGVVYLGKCPGGDNGQPDEGFQPVFAFEVYLVGIPLWNNAIQVGSTAIPPASGCQGVDASSLGLPFYSVRFSRGYNHGGGSDCSLSMVSRKVGGTNTLYHQGTSAAVSQDYVVTGTGGVLPGAAVSRTSDTEVYIQQAMEAVGKNTVLLNEVERLKQHLQSTEQEHSREISGLKTQLKESEDEWNNRMKICQQETGATLRLWQEQKQQLEGELNETRNKLTHLDTEYKTIINDRRLMQGKLQSSENEIFAYRSKLHQLESQNIKLEEELVRKKAEYQEKINKFNSEHDEKLVQTLAENSSLLTRLRSYEVLIKSHESNIAELQRLITLKDLKLAESSQIISDFNSYNRRYAYNLREVCQVIDRMQKDFNHHHSTTSSNAPDELATTTFLHPTATVDVVDPNKDGGTGSSSVSATDEESLGAEEVITNENAATQQFMPAELLDSTIGHADDNGDADIDDHGTAGEEGADEAGTYSSQSSDANEDDRSVPSEETADRKRLREAQEHEPLATYTPSSFPPASVTGNDENNTMPSMSQQHQQEPPLPPGALLKPKQKIAGSFEGSSSSEEEEEERLERGEEFSQRAGSGSSGISIHNENDPTANIPVGIIPLP